MHNLKLLWVVPLFLATSSALAAPSNQPDGVDPDTRSKLLLPADERHLVLHEMRNFVIAIHDITAGVANNDMGAIATAARRMGSNASGEIPPQVVAKLPPTFKQLAGRVHASFDMIAMDAMDIGDGIHTIEQLSTLTGHCVACHAIYQIEKLPSQ
jgi:hypothetical protein